MRINNNLMAMNTHRQLGVANNAGAKSMEKLSSGYRINRAGDDAAGLAISEKMRGQIRGLNQASANAQDGISLIQTAEGALNETHSILQRMRELAVQASTDTNTTEDRKEIQKEVDQLAQEITRISTDTEFNTKKLLNGELIAADATDATDMAAAALTFHIGANQDQNTTLNIADMGATGLGVNTVDEEGDAIAADAVVDMTEDDAVSAGINLTTQVAADRSITIINEALETVSGERSKLGAMQNRLEHTIKNLDTSSENLQASEARIRDVDMAKEMMEQTKQNILSQASTAMLAQANQAPQGVLQLLR